MNQGQNFPNEGPQIYSEKKKEILTKPLVLFAEHPKQNIKKKKTIDNTPVLFSKRILL